MHTGVEIVVNLVLVTLGLEHIHTVIGRVRGYTGVVAPNAIVGRSIVLNEFVHIAAGLCGVLAVDAANTHAESLG